MPLFEVKVLRNSTVYYEVEARDRESALVKFQRDEPVGEVIDNEQVLTVTDLADDEVDDRELIDEYEEEQFEFDE
jgi:hypothetical protein